MFELLVPATVAQLEHVGGLVGRYDKELRPSLMVLAMKQLQEAGVESDVWKLEGIETPSDSRKIVDQARIGGRTHVGVIVLGRGENGEKVHHWLSVAAQVSGWVGFAVGRTIFWEPLKKFREGKHSRQAAIDVVAQNYKAFCDLWVRVRSESR